MTEYQSYTKARSPFDSVFWHLHLLVLVHLCKFYPQHMEPSSLIPSVHFFCLFQTTVAASNKIKNRHTNYRNHICNSSNWQYSWSFSCWKYGSSGQERKRTATSLIFIFFKLTFKLQRNSMWLHQSAAEKQSVLTKLSKLWTDINTVAGSQTVLKHGGNNWRNTVWAGIKEDVWVC